jgi:hypothetical protein
VRECVRGLRPRLRFVLAAAAFALALGGCEGPCGEEVVQHEPSPYGTGTAIVFVRDCGATTGFATQVSLVGDGDAGRGGRNVVFVADDDHGAAPSWPGGGTRVRVRWVNANHLEVAHHPRARTFRREESHGAVRITYAALP